MSRRTFPCGPFEVTLGWNTAARAFGAHVYDPAAGRDVLERQTESESDTRLADLAVLARELERLGISFPAPLFQHLTEDAEFDLRVVAAYPATTFTGTPASLSGPVH